MRKLAILFTWQSRQAANNSAFLCFLFTQPLGIACTSNMLVQLVLNRHINICCWSGGRSPVCEMSDGTSSVLWGWPKELVVATLRHQSSRALDLMAGSLGTWKPLVDFCHFLLFPAMGITERLVLGQW